MKSILAVIIIFTGSIFLYKIDTQFRYLTDLPEYYSEEEHKFFMYYKTVEESQETIESYCGSAKYKFPREEIKMVEYYKNIPLVSNLTSKKLSENETETLVSIINNQNNFDWGETTSRISDSHHFFIFYNNNNDEMARLWVCNEKCRVARIKPWLPSIKYGGLSEKGKLNFSNLIDKIQMEH